MRFDQWVGERDRRLSHIALEQARYDEYVACTLEMLHTIPPNISEGYGKRSLLDRSRFLDVARGPTPECVAIHDILAATNGLDDESQADVKRLLHRSISMLSRLIT
ncbi:MAG: four helix bundle protein [Rubripirellula sp.]|nr:four helix bundle protein [Rubripirellula sp.]